jgi:hypothetical protein
VFAIAQSFTKHLFATYIYISSFQKLTIPKQITKSPILFIRFMIQYLSGEMQPTEIYLLLLDEIHTNDNLLNKLRNDDQGEIK